MMLKEERIKGQGKGLGHNIGERDMPCDDGAVNNNTSQGAGVYKCLVCKHHQVSKIIPHFENESTDHCSPRFALFTVSLLTLSV